MGIETEKSLRQSVRELRSNILSYRSSQHRAPVFGDTLRARQHGKDRGLKWCHDRLVELMKNHNIEID